MAQIGLNTCLTALKVLFHCCYRAVLVPDLETLVPDLEALVPNLVILVLDYETLVPYIEFIALFLMFPVNYSLFLRKQHLLPC